MDFPFGPRIHKLPVYRARPVAGTKGILYLPPGRRRSRAVLLRRPSSSGSELAEGWCGLRDDRAGQQRRAAAGPAPAAEGVAGSDSGMGALAQRRRRRRRRRRLRILLGVPVATGLSRTRRIGAYLVKIMREILFFGGDSTNLIDPAIIRF